MKDSLTPNSKERAWALTLRELDSKADKAWVEAKLHYLEDTLSCARSAMGQPHECYHDREIENLMNYKEKILNFRILIVITIVTAILAMATQFFLLKGSVDMAKSNIHDMRESITLIQKEQKKLQDTFQSVSNRQAGREQELVGKIEQIMINQLAKKKKKQR